MVDKYPHSIYYVKYKRTDGRLDKVRLCRYCKTEPIINPSEPCEVRSAAIARYRKEREHERRNESSDSNGS